VKLYDRGVYVHHYTNFMEKSNFDEALENCNAMIESYE